MLANYNIAVENEHLGKQEAIFYYETALSLAK